MTSSYLLPDWNTLAAYDDDELPLLDTALLIARDEYPQLDAGFYVEQIRRFATDLQPHINDNLDLPSQLTAINRYLFEEQGFAGNHSHYDDPRNSYLNEVLDRKLGIPISLAVVQIELMRKLGPGPGWHIFSRTLPGKATGGRRHSGDGPFQQRAPSQCQKN